MTEASQNEVQTPQQTAAPSAPQGQGPQGAPGHRTDRNVDLRPMEVRVDGDNINRAINQLKRKMANEGIYKELKKRRFFEKPSEQRKRKQREAERRLRKSQRRAS